MRSDEATQILTGNSWQAKMRSDEATHKQRCGQTSKDAVRRSKDAVRRSNADPDSYPSNSSPRCWSGSSTNGEFSYSKTGREETKEQKVKEKPRWSLPASGAWLFGSQNRRLYISYQRTGEARGYDSQLWFGEIWDKGRTPNRLTNLR